MILINSLGVLLIALIIYWFWFAKPKSLIAEKNSVDIIVNDGVYTPAHIEIEVGKPVMLKFLRKDPSPCAEKVIFSALNISEELPINKKKAIQLKIEQPGEYEFTCQMQMYRGTLIVK